MNKHEFNKLAQFEKTYWWHRGKLHMVASLMEKYLPQTTSTPIILEIGCGTGEVLRTLSKFGDTHGLDISQAALDFCAQNGFTNTILGDINEIDIKKYKNKYDVVVALDVLEHVQDDVLAMTKVRHILKENGVFIISVPAHKYLWSVHDEALHHKRRYHKYELTKKLEDSNFEIIKNTYFVSTVYPAILMYRMITNILGRDAYPKTTYVTLPDSINNLFYKILEIESMLIKRMSIPFGTSLVVVAKKTKVSQDLW